jgi:glutathione S-transferase
MLELHQFEMSHYAEKVRLILDYKGLAYKKNEVTPGLGQIELFQLSGQRQVPVLQDEGKFIADSTAIAEYLEQKYPDKPILPDHPYQRGQCLILEQWADEYFGIAARKAMFGALNQDQNFRTAFLPTTTPDILKTLVGAIPSNFLSILGEGMGWGSEVKTAQDDLKRSLTALGGILAEQPYLVGDAPTLADFAVAGLSMYLKFPTGNYLAIPETLKGMGVPGIADAEEFAAFFAWRDRLYADIRQVAGAAGPTSGPTAINID